MTQSRRDIYCCQMGSDPKVMLFPLHQYVASFLLSFAAQSCHSSKNNDYAPTIISPG